MKLIESLLTVDQLVIIHDIITDESINFSNYNKQLLKETLFNIKNQLFVTILLKEEKTQQEKEIMEQIFHEIKINQ